MTTLVYLDNDDARRDELALHAVRIDGTWNGWVIPVVSADELKRFISENAANDPNGSWNVASVIESADWLEWRWADGQVDSWVSTGETDEHGNALYALDGWTWSL